MNVSHKTGSFLVGANVFLCPMTKVYGVFINRFLPSDSGGNSRMKAVACIVLRSWGLPDQQRRGRYHTADTEFCLTPPIALLVANFILEITKF